MGSRAWSHRRARLQEQLRRRKTSGACRGGDVQRRASLGISRLGASSVGEEQGDGVGAPGMGGQMEHAPGSGLALGLGLRLGLGYTPTLTLILTLTLTLALTLTLTLALALALAGGARPGRPHRARGAEPA